MTTDATAIETTADRIVIRHLAVRDAELAAFVAEHDEEARAELVERAVRVGLLSLRSARATMDVDVVRREFDRLAEGLARSNADAMDAMERCLRDAFGDDSGRLPRTMEAFLGDRGRLRACLDDLFDDERRDSAIGRMRTLLGGYFDGDGSTLARLLDPRREDSPLHGFRAEIREGLRLVDERLLALEAARTARAEERGVGTAKGRDFEDEIEARLGALANACGDLVERTGDEAGTRLRCKQGDFVVALNPAWTRRPGLRVAVEAKSGPVGLPAIVRELDGARVNRTAAVAVAVFRRGAAPAGCAPLTLHGEHVLCEVDPDDPDDRTLDMAMRLARALVVAMARSAEAGVDAAVLTRRLDAIRGLLEAVRGMKNQLGSITNASTAVGAQLDVLRTGVLEQVAAIEADLDAAARELRGDAA